jgi:CubicO group peptidase (beta-lactamase class C family)
VLAIAFASLAGACSAQEPGLRMQQLVQSYADSGWFMGGVLVAQNGKVLLSKGYGWADLEWNVPNSPTARFQIASMTKQCTAASILLLEDRGKLKTDDLVKKYPPDAPAAWDKGTIYHRLTHTSGIPDDAAKYEPGPPDRLFFAARPLVFQQGEKWRTPTCAILCLGTCWKGSADKPTRISFRRIFSSRWLGTIPDLTPT